MLEEAWLTVEKGGSFLPTQVYSSRSTRLTPNGRQANSFGCLQDATDSGNWECTLCVNGCTLEADASQISDAKRFGNRNSLELGRRTGVYVQLLPLCWKAGE
jgi:hypothetical protein